MAKKKKQNRAWWFILGLTVLIVVLIKFGYDIVSQLMLKVAAWVGLTDPFYAKLAWFTIILTVLLVVFRVKLKKIFKRLSP